MATITLSRTFLPSFSCSSRSFSRRIQIGSGSFRTYRLLLLLLGGAAASGAGGEVGASGCRVGLRVRLAEQ